MCPKLYDPPPALSPSPRFVFEKPRQIKIISTCSVRVAYTLLRGFMHDVSSKGLMLLGKC